MKRIFILCIASLVLISMVGCGNTTEEQTVEEEQYNKPHHSTVTILNTRTGEVLNVYENVKWIDKKTAKRKNYITIAYYRKDGSLAVVDVGLNDDISYIEREEE